MRIITLLIVASLNLAFSQDEPVEVSSPLSASVDIASRYVWRGTDFGNSPSIQPGITYTSGALTLGAWSAWQHSGLLSEMTYMHHTHLVIIQLPLLIITFQEQIL
mgnify:CR=1 FL=1